MDRVRRWLIGVLLSERGQDMVEYGLITLVISMAIVFATVGTGLTGAFETWGNDVASCLGGAGSCPLA